MSKPSGVAFDFYSGGQLREDEITELGGLSFHLRDGDFALTPRNYTAVEP